jgi:helicase
MRVSDLAKFGVPKRIIEIWQKRQGEMLLPVQSRAVRKGLLGNKDAPFESQSIKTGDAFKTGDACRMLIAAPTSGGKSFCAEMAMVKALTHRQKTVVLVPLKSLAEHRHLLFQQTYGPLGVKCLIVSGDHPENDKKFADSDYQIAIAIYEKFDLLLTAALDAMKNIGLIVVDEIQTIADPERGAILERLLTKIQASVYNPSIIGLSAVIGDNAASAGHLAEWLGAALVEETARPVDLVRGVAAEGSFRYRSYNSGLDGSEPFVEITAADEPFDGFIQQIKSDSGSTLVFLKSRRETVECAFKLAASVSWPEAKKALEQLSEEEPSFLVRSLRQALSRGVAFHNADLSPRQRTIVEQAFIDREVKVIFSTTTLALGVDLPADIVYLETVKYSSGEYGTRPTLIPVSRAEFDNMTGRAGRLRDGNTKRGRAIVLAQSDFDREILWENYIAPDTPEPIASAFNSMPLEDWLLNMIVTGLVSDSASAESLFADTFYAHLNGEQAQLRQVTPVKQVMPVKQVAPADFDVPLAALSDHHFITLDTLRGRFTATALGQAAAKTGLSAAQAKWLLGRMAQSLPQTISGWTALALSAPGWNLPAGMLTGYELNNNLPVRLLYQHFDYLLDEAAILLGDNYRREPLSYLSAARLKAFLLLHEWSRLAPIQQLEERFQMHLGQIMALGDTAAHLVAGLALLIEATDRENPLREQLGEIAFSLRFGIPAAMQQLHTHFAEILHRGDFLALQKAGVEHLANLNKLSDEQIEKIITGENKIQLLKQKLETLQEEIDMHTQTVMTDTRTPASMASRHLMSGPESVEIDGTYERERYLVKINGFPVRLTGKSFKYFTKLAWARLNSANSGGWLYKEDIEVGFNQARYLYRMKNEIASALNSPWPVFENNRLGYYRLDIDPSKIRINFDNLKAHPDYELRVLAGELNAEAVS